MPARVYLAIDLGAESGRVMAGLWNGRTIRLDEIHRFSNGPVHLGDSLRWDVLRLWAEIQNGLALAARKYGKSIVSVGADTWGVDYVLLDRRDEMLGQPYAYRDARTNGVMEKAFRKVPRSEIFAQTGLQFMQFNSWRRNRTTPNCSTPPIACFSCPTSSTGRCAGRGSPSLPSPPPHSASTP